MQVLIVGGGVIGLATACALAREGHDVQLAERETPGQRASWVAAGLLTPSSPWKYPQALVDLCLRSEAMYADFVADLLGHTGLDPEYEVAGMLYPEGVGLGAEEVAHEERRRTELGFQGERLDRAQLDALQPGFAPAVSGAGWQPRAARVRPPRLLAALRRRCEQLGVLVTSHCEVAALAGGPRGVHGALTTRGQFLEAETVVLAAGSWSGRLAASLGLSISVRPVRGQILLLAGPPGLIGPTINNGESYLVPRRDGRILVGSTMEDAGFNECTNPETLLRLRSLAASILPVTRELPVEADWAGLRPGTPDRMPYLGRVPGLPGLVLATGHYRNGILLAPATAALIADLLAGRAPDAQLAPFAPRAIDPQALLVPVP
jgi:glycine oxidase